MGRKTIRATGKRIAVAYLAGYEIMRKICVKVSMDYPLTHIQDAWHFGSLESCESRKYDAEYQMRKALTEKGRVVTLVLAKCVSREEMIDIDG